MFLFLFHRAVVEARTDKDEQKYRVRYIDFGNEEDGVKCDRMVLLPDNLASVSQFLHCSVQLYVVR